MLKQFGGFNIKDESDPEYMLPKIKNILKTLEKPGSDLAFINEIIEKFNECYKILLDFYSDNSFYNQTIVKTTGQNFVSEFPVRKLHLNFGALILMSFLSELEMNYLLYKGIDPVNKGTPKEKEPIKINKISNPRNNFLEVIWPSDWDEDEKRIYKDTLPIDFETNKNIIKTIDDFCTELNNVFNTFCNMLLDNLVNKLNKQNYNYNYTRNDLDIIFWYEKSPDHIYENWREQLIRDVSSRSSALGLTADTHNSTVAIILTQLTRTCSSFSNGSKEMQYYIDGFGFFSWMYLDQYSSKDKGIKHFGNCFTQTLIEHFLLYGVHLKTNSINIAGFYQDLINYKDSNTFSTLYRLTNKSIFNKLSQQEARIKETIWNYVGITHWATKIYNDITILDGVKIVINPSFRTIREPYIIQATKPRDRFLSNTPFSIFDDKWTYLKALLYPNFDSMITFIEHNRNLLKNEISNSIKEYIYKIFNYIETIVQKKEYNSISLPLSNIKQQPNNNINLDNIKMLPQLILRANKKFFINSYDNNIMSRTSNLLGDTFYKTDSIIDKNITAYQKNPLFNKLIISSEKKEEKKEEERKKNIKDKFKNIITKFIVMEFYKNTNTTYNFFKLINDIFNEGIKEYISQKKLPSNSINFIFKGGNILKLVVETYINELPGNVRTEIKDLINKNFKKSDADFQINIKDLTKTETNPKTVNEMNIIEEEVTTLAYLLLYRIRNEILTNQKKYIDFYNLDFDSKKKLLEILLDFLNKVKKENSKTDDTFELNNKEYDFTNVTFDNVSLRNSQELIVKISDENKYEIFGIEPGKDTRKDFSITTENSNPHKYHLNILPYLLLFNNDDISDALREKQLDLDIYKDRSDTNFYISVNKTITNFILVRMKVSMKLEYSNGTENRFGIFPGEFIDVSILKYTDTDPYFTEENMKNYEIKGDNPFTFKSFSNNGFIKNFFEMLEFSTTNNILPWDTPKYEVRLTRLFVLFLIDLMSKLSNTECLNYITILKNTFKLLLEIKYDLDKDIDKYITKIEQVIINFITNNDKNLLCSLSLFINNYFTNNNGTNIFKKIKALSNYGDNIEKFNKMIRHILRTLPIFINVLKKNSEYKKNDISIITQSKLELNDLNSNNIKTSYDKKYLLYDLNTTSLNPNLGKNFKDLYLKYKDKYLKLKKLLNN